MEAMVKWDNRSRVSSAIRRWSVIVSPFFRHSKCTEEASPFTTLHTREKVDPRGCAMKRGRGSNRGGISKKQIEFNNLRAEAEKNTNLQHKVQWRWKLLRPKTWWSRMANQTSNVNHRKILPLMAELANNALLHWSFYHRHHHHQSPICAPALSA